MKKQLNQLRRFFSRTSAKKLNAATAREAIPASYDDDETDTRLSGAFVIVLILHIIALIGVFAFTRIRDNNPSPALAGDTKKAAAPALAAAQPGRTAPQPTVPRLEPVAAIFPPEPELPRLPLPGGANYYTVKTGDNLTRIALAYGLKPADIVAANRLKNQDDIRAGQELILPAAQTMPPAPESKGTARAEVKSMPPNKSTPPTYTIKKTDTLTKVARELGVSYDELAKLNNIKDPRKLQVGQVLKVPKKG